MTIRNRLELNSLMKPGDTLLRYRRIAVPFNEDRSSERAIVKGIELARQHKAQLVLIYVYQPSETGSTAGIVSPVQLQRDHQARLYVKAWCAKIGSQGCAVHGYCVPGRSIQSAGGLVVREQADVIVITNERRSSFGTFFTDNLVRYFEKITSTRVVTA